MPTPVATNPADVYSSIGINNPLPANRGNAEVGQNDFLRLMLEQLRNQDPLNPEKGADFVAQLAQFSTVSGIEKLSAGFAGLVDSMRGSQALSAAGLVGTSALVGADTVAIAAAVDADEEFEVSGAVDLASSGAVTIEIVNATGTVVRTIPLGSQPAGLAEFSWDGENDAGTRVPAGDYKVRATVNGETAPTLLSARIDSVSLGAEGALLALAGLGNFPLTSVRRFG
jgi:flagellar basal-body rod modification protein FlgD